MEVHGGAAQVGEGNAQINYFYNHGTWSDGVALPPLTSVKGYVESPYRGLGAFGELDAPFFFGREDAVNQVMELMARRVEDHRGLLVVSGASGVGKSSLLKAGVLPRLRGAGLRPATEAASWPCLMLTPGRAPLDELAVRVAQLAGVDASAVRRNLSEDPGTFSLTARQATIAGLSREGHSRGEQPPGGPRQERLLLVVDQFEQVFTQCPDERERQAFITALCAAAATGSGGEPTALVLLGMRADFEARCTAYPELAAVVQDRYLVTPMTERQLRLAITGPARQAGSGVEGELTQVLLSEMRSRRTGNSGAGTLPLLSHALDQAWRLRAGPTLTLADYERTGGIERAIATSAERAYGRLTTSQQEAARQVFTRLATTTADGIDTADRATWTELVAGLTPVQVADLRAVLETFAAERLLTLANNSVEISHEALLTAWPLLCHTWLEESRAQRLMRTRLRAAAQDWAANERNRSYLWRGSLLTAATAPGITAGQSGMPSPLGIDEREFLTAGIKSARRGRRVRQALGVLLALVLIAGGIAGTVIHDDQRATAREHVVAAAGELAAESAGDSLTDPTLSRQEALAAYRIDPAPQTRYALEEAATDDALAVLPVDAFEIAFSPAGKFLVTLERSGTLRLWSAHTYQQVGSAYSVRSGQDNVWGLAFSPGGSRLAVLNGTSSITLFTVTGESLGHPQAVHGCNGYTPTAVAFDPQASPGTGTLAVGGTAGEARLHRAGEHSIARGARRGGCRSCEQRGVQCERDRPRRAVRYSVEWHRASQHPSTGLRYSERAAGPEHRGKLLQREHRLRWQRPTGHERPARRAALVGGDRLARKAALHPRCHERR